MGLTVESRLGLSLSQTEVKIKAAARTEIENKIGLGKKLHPSLEISCEVKTPNDGFLLLCQRKMTDSTVQGLVDTGKFSHLFPTTSKQYTSGVPNTVVDYVIVFRYPTTPPSKTITREALSTEVSTEFQALSAKLCNSNLWYQVKEGADSNTLLILVYCPWTVLKKHLYRSRYVSLWMHNNCIHSGFILFYFSLFVH
jgi:hypothetical protein